MKKWIPLVMAAGLAGCCSDVTQTPTPGNDASADTTPDLVLDHGPADAPPDHGPLDATPDHGPDAAPDGGPMDATPDASPDVMPDASPDVTPDAGPVVCPACVGAGCAVVEIGTGSRFSCARRASGQVLCWGDNGLGQLGNGTTASSSTPVEVRGLCDAIDLEVGAGMACARTRSGRGVCWGSNANGNLGGGRTFEALPQSPLPLAAPALDGATAMSCGAGYCCVMRSTGLWCWGSNRTNQLGIGSTDPLRLEPAMVPGSSDIVAVSASTATAAVRMSGTALTWGANVRGRLGMETPATSPTPIPVPGITDATDVSAGVWHMCALRTGGVVSCWGNNTFGELGRGAPGADVGAPAAVPGLTGVVRLALGYHFTCALAAAGTVSCWGSNGYGELGRGMSSTFVATPAPIAGLTDVTQVSAESNNDSTPEGTHACALRSNGDVLCWGNNNTGQLGDGTTTNRSVPTAVRF